MKSALALLMRCRTLRDESAQRVVAHAAHHVQQAQADESHRRAAMAAEAGRQLGEQRALLERMLQQDVQPQAMADQLERHHQRRDDQYRRVQSAVHLCHHLERHLAYAQRLRALRARALERAGQLQQQALNDEAAQQRGAEDTVEEEFLATWSRQQRRGGPL
jgi:hypothetical protein